jgi:AhpD family alkylhydroperoxidase
MPVRLPYREVAPGVYRAMRALQDHVNASGLEHSLLELVKLRVSYINGCAFCVDMHTKDARVGGETEQRLFAFTSPS